MVKHDWLYEDNHSCFKTKLDRTLSQSLDLDLSNGGHGLFCRYGPFEI